jgi:regulatory protein
VKPPRKPVDPPSAYQKALGLLVRREHSRKELKRKLTQREVEPEEAESAVERLGEQDFQNDARFAVALARTRASAGYGPQRIRIELGGHGVTGEEIDAALEACEADWLANARNALGRRYSPDKANDPTARRKAADFLFRRGFDHETVYAALKFEVE